LRRDLGARQQEIKGGRDKRCGGGPFLDRKCQAVRRRQR
jgi:hypothetical protein